MVNPQKPFICTMCDRKGTMVCSGCKSIHYCSTTCQKIDWPVHKIICKNYTQFATTRPDLDHHSAIYFHPDEAQPRFMWLRFQPGHSHPSFEQLAQLGISKDRIEACPLEEFGNNPMLKRHFDSHHIVLSLPEAKNLCPRCSTDLNPNESLRKVDEELANFFRGPVLAIATYCDSDLERKAAALDLGPVDFRHVVDNLRMVYCQCEDDTRRVLDGGNIKAVRLNCVGDSIFVKRPLSEAVLEPKSALLADSDVPTPVADKIGIPLVVRKMPPAVVWRDSRRTCLIKNLHATMLNPPHQSEDTGSLIVVRKDGKPLHPMHIQALCAYTATKLGPNHPEDACLTGEMRLAELIDQVSKEDFKAWYPTMKQGCSIHHQVVPSPFDIQDDSDDADAGFIVKHK